MTNKKPGLFRRVLSFIGGFITALRRTVVNLIFLLIVFAVGAAIVSQEVINVTQDSILVLAPTGDVVDQRSFVDPLTRVLDPESVKAESRLQDLIDAVNHAAVDPKISGMLIRQDELGYISMSSAMELGDAIETFKVSGKKVIASADSFSQQSYLLASYADEIYLHPMGAIILQGLGAYPTYFKTALEKLGVDVHVFRVGEYKSAVEPFLRDDMSILAKQNALQWLNTLWESYTAQLVLNRDLEEDEISNYVNNFDLVLQDVQGNAAHAALNLGLVDQLMSREEMLNAAMTMTERNEPGEAMIDYLDYLELSNGAPVLPAEDQVAVVVAAGVIVDGEQPPGVTGGDTVARLLASLRDDDAVKAVVLRVDSSGGSAFASEVMREQLALLQAVGKPVVVSMGGVAASGGYWIAAGADEIWAHPTTITGSIGIFGVFPTVHRTLAKWGIHSDGVGTTRLADAFRVDRPMSDISSNSMQAMINDGYHRFVQLVADSRGMSVDAVESIAQGRVWSGRDALAIGLVDSLGTLQDAAASAAELAGLEQYELVWKGDESWYQDSILDRLMVVVSARMSRQLRQSLGQVFTPLFGAELPEVPVFNDPRGIYLQCLACASSGL